MKHLKPLTAVAALIFFSISQGLFAADNSSHIQQVETLFKLTQMEKKVDQSIDSIMEMQLSQNPALSVHQAKMRAFFEKHIGWAALKNDIIAMYLKTFSEDELKAINDFYITPAGQKVITALPGLVQQRNQLAMMRLQQNIGELQQIIGAPQPTAQ
jgi:uncharacterized protein